MVSVSITVALPVYFFLRGKVGDHGAPGLPRKSAWTGRTSSAGCLGAPGCKIGVDKGIHTGTSCKVRNDKIIGDIVKCHQKAGEDTWDDVRKYDLEEGI